MTDGSADVWWRRVPLLEYLEQRGWKPYRDTAREEVAGLCPLHRESRPSFYVNRRKNLFYCHGCGRGGDLIRLIELLDGVGFRQALAQALTGPPDTAAPAGVLDQAFGFYQQQLPRSPQALRYLAERGIHGREVIARMRIGYAPGACLGAHLRGCGFAGETLAGSGLFDARGRDRFWRCVTFPLVAAGNLYGRSIDSGGPRHRFLPGSKGGLYGWPEEGSGPSIIAVEGLFDVASLWQAGFDGAVAVLGAQASPHQMSQLCASGSRTVYVCLDADLNGAGQRAARRLVPRLRQAGVEALRVDLPAGADPASWFRAGASAADFQRCLDGARP